MSHVANIEASFSEPTQRASIGAQKLLIAVALLTITIVLVAAQLIFVANDPVAREAAVNGLRIDIMAPWQ